MGDRDETRESPCWPPQEIAKDVAEDDVLLAVNGTGQLLRSGCGVVSVNRYRIGKAVTEVELGFVASLSILEVRTRRGLDVIASERYHLDAGVADQFEQLLRTGDTVAPEYDDGCFDQGRGSDEEVAGVLGKDDFQSLGIGFIFDDRDESRGVDDHLPRQSVLVVEVFLLEGFEERKVPDFSRELVDVRA
jgi:hypothetical protein